MTEEDTFRRLKRSTFEEVHAGIGSFSRSLSEEERARLLSTTDSDSEAEAEELASIRERYFQSYGWTFDEYKAAGLRTRHTRTRYSTKDD